jgi:Smg protein
MFDILVFVYEHCRQADVTGDPDRVARRLSAAGFDEMEISAALTWLAGLARAPHRSHLPLPAQRAAFRVLAGSLASAGSIAAGCASRSNSRRTRATICASLGASVGESSTRRHGRVGS